MAEHLRRRAVVSGIVQGVSFRYYARAAARDIGAKGWVRNLPNGRVEAVVEGPPHVVEAMLDWLRKGSPYGRVDHVQVYEERYTGEFSDFDISFARGDYW